MEGEEAHARGFESHDPLFACTGPAPGYGVPVYQFLPSVCHLPSQRVSGFTALRDSQNRVAA